MYIFCLLHAYIHTYVFTMYVCLRRHVHMWRMFVHSDSCWPHTNYRDANICPHLLGFPKQSQKWFSLNLIPHLNVLIAPVSRECVLMGFCWKKYAYYMELFVCDFGCHERNAYVCICVLSTELSVRALKFCKKIYLRVLLNRFLV